MNADLCLAWSDDNGLLYFYNKPLITNSTIGKLGIYKPSAGVLPNGTFFLYYTAQDEVNRALNKLYVSQIPFEELINRVSK